MQPTGHIFCRPATVYASWVNGTYLLQTQIYYCDTNYTTHSTESQIPFLIIIIFFKEIYHSRKWF